MNRIVRDRCGFAFRSPHPTELGVDQRGVARSTPCTIGPFDMSWIFYGTFEEH